MDAARKAICGPPCYFLAYSGSLKAFTSSDLAGWREGEAEQPVRTPLAQTPERSEGNLELL